MSRRLSRRCREAIAGLESTMEGGRGLLLGDRIGILRCSGEWDGRLCGSMGPRSLQELDATSQVSVRN